MAFVQDQDPLGQFPVQRSNQSFADRVRPRRSGCAGEDPYAVRGEDRVEVDRDEEQIDLLIIRADDPDQVHTRRMEQSTATFRPLPRRIRRGALSIRPC